MNDINNALPPGTVLDSGVTRYTIAGVIGHGGFGITYRATTRVRVGNIMANVTVAIKEFFIADDCERTHLAGQETTMVTSSPARQRVEAAKGDFIAEANRLRALAGMSDNIVRVNEVFEANGTAYYVMEYLEGPSLREYVARRGRLSERETIGVMMPLLRAVEMLHTKRIMHLDIKPGNVVMVQDGVSERPVLIDFGQSKHYDDAGSSTRTVGAAGVSDGYAPVEQYSGITRFSPETDVYALAATTLFCLSGRKPPRAMELDSDAPTLYPSDITPRLRGAIRNALVISPQRRTPTVAAFIHDLVGYGEPLPPLPRPKPGIPLWGRMVIAILCAGIVFGLIAVIYTFNGAKTGGTVHTPSEIYEAPADTAMEVADEAEVAVPEAPAEEVRSGTAPPLMHTYNYSGYFIDSTGQRWPVKLTAETNGEGRWGKCVYTNVNYNIVLNMTGSGSGDNYTFYTNESGADLTIRISYSGEGVWEGTATSGSKTLSVLLYE